jgi:hypothetical protein
MKRYSLITLLFLAILTIYSCKERELTYFELETAAALTNPVSGGTFVLMDANADNVFQTFVWTEAVYNVVVTVTYDIEIDLKSNNFSDPFVLGTTENDSLAVNVFDFNKFLTVDMGLEPGVPHEISIRVVSYAKTSDRSYSAAIDMTVTPYDPPYAPDQLFVISGGSVVGKLMPIDGNGNYQGYAWLSAGSLEYILSESETGTPFYGDNEPNDVLDLDGTAVTVAEEGHYRMAVSTYTFEYENVKQAWGIIGSAIPNYDWASDIDMAYIGNHKWEISTDTLTVGTGTFMVHTGKFKFRPNDGWEPYNWGDDEGDGIPEDHGADIDITEGNWKFTLDLSEFPYFYTVTQIVK